MRLLCYVSLLTCFCSSLQANDNATFEQVRRLRREHKFDKALAELQRLDSIKAIDEKVRLIIPYERAVTLFQQDAKSAQQVDERELRNQALELFREFAKTHPDHALAPNANLYTGRILSDLAQHELSRLRSPNKDFDRLIVQEKARSLFENARKAFQAAHDQQRANWAAFPKFIDRKTEPARYEERRRAESQYIQSQYRLARCSYDEAQTYDAGTDDNRELIATAAGDFRATSCSLSNSSDRALCAVVAGQMLSRVRRPSHCNRYLQ